MGDFAFQAPEAAIRGRTPGGFAAVSRGRLAEEPRGRARSAIEAGHPWPHSWRFAV